jgi:c-di-GMP-binding flagellar brake protein YcgR
MADIGNVQGSKMLDLFRYLIESKKILSLQVIGTRFECLTFVTEFNENSTQSHIVINLPSDFEKAVENLKELELSFNFNGPDSVEYIFTTKGGTYEKKELTVLLPDYVKRLQRRKNFRLLTPKGTQMNFQSKNFKGSFDLINISLGGTYCVLELKGLPISKKPVLKVKQPIFNISIVFPGQQSAKKNDIYIKKAEVVRVEADKKSFRHKYAFEFKYMDKDEKQKLTESIYRLQREYLQRR